jgi:transglutaminase-like putative cysteine protease
MRNLIFGAACLLLLPFYGNAQKFEDVLKAYPDQEAVFLQYKRELRLMMQGDTPVAESRHLNEMMILSDRNAGLFSRSTVYHSGFNELKELEAYTLSADGRKKTKIGEQKTTSSSSNAVFYDDVKETSFDFPALQQGATAVESYTLLHKDAHLLTPFIYPSRIPAVKVSFTAIVPDEITIDYKVRNDPQGLLKFKKDRKRGQTVYTWEMDNVKNDMNYSDAPDDYYYRPHVILFITSYTNSNGKQPYFGTVADLFKWNAAFLKTLNTTEDPALRKITDSLVAGKPSAKEKAIAIYQWVQKSIRYVAFENGLEGFRPRQAAEVCSKRYGDCKDMSSIITQMLKMAGIKAYYTWIGTRDLPYAYSDVALPIVDNHMISVAEIDGQWYFLDGTAPNAKIDLPPYHIQGKEALIALNDKDFKVLKVPEAAATVNTLTDSTFVRFTPKGVAGFEKVDYQGYFAEDLYNTLMYRDGKSREDYIKARMSKGSNKFMLGRHQVSPLNERSNYAHISADFELPDYGKKIGSEYYINLNLEKVFENQLIDTAKRKVPRQSNYRYNITQHHILEIPEGYKVTYKPENLAVDNPFYALSISYTVEKNRVIATQKLVNKTLMLQPDQFATWNKDIPAVQAHYKEQIVLEKQ